MQISDLVIPVLLLALLVLAVIKKIPAYEVFTEGAKKSIDLCLSIFPCIVSIFLAIELFRISGLSEKFANFISPAFSLVGIPKEICELVVLRPFSGSGSMSILDTILTQYGADSYIGKCASVVMGSSETVFYISAVYLAGTKMKKTYVVIPIALVANFIGAIVGCFLCRFF